MLGDKSKQRSRLVRFIDWFGDGRFTRTIKGKHKIPSQGIDKRYERRYRRRIVKQDLNKEQQC